MINLAKAASDNEDYIRNGYTGSLAIGLAENEPQKIHLYIYGRKKHNFPKQIEVDGEIIPIVVHYGSNPKPA